MSLSFLEGLGAFAQGVQERSSEIDADLAARIKELNDKAPDENLKSRFADEYARWTKDRDLIESVKSAGGAGTEQGQFLLGGYDSIEAYREAYARDNSIYHTLFNIGDAPVLTPTQYGLTNVDSSGKTRTTASKLFNKAFRPEIYEKNQEYADNKKDVEGSTTKYFRREGNANTDEVIAANKTKLSTTFTTNKPSELPDTLTIHKEVDGVMMTYFLSKTNEENKEMGTSLEGFDDYRVLGDPTRKNAPSEFTMKLKAHTDTKPEDVVSPTYEKDLEEWTYKYNKLMFGETFKEGPKVGEITSGVYDSNGNQVNVQYTGEDTDNFMNMQGYRQFGGTKAEETIKVGTTKEYYDKESNTVQQLVYLGGDAKYKNLNGWQTFGDPKTIEEKSVSLQTTYNDAGQEVKIYYTGNLEDSWNGKDKGWVQVGDAKEAVDNWSALDAMERIDDAILNGVTITEKEYESGRISFMRTKGAMEAGITNALGTYEELVLMVRDLKFMSVPEIINGKKTNNTVPATPNAIEKVAEFSGQTVREVRLKLVDTYNKRKLKTDK